MEETLDFLLATFGLKSMNFTKNILLIYLGAKTDLWKLFYKLAMVFYLSSL